MTPLRNLALVACAGGAIATALPAHAAGTMSCASPNAEARVEINVGQLPALVPLWIRIALNGEIWSTLDGEGTPVAILQAFDEAGAFSVDVADPNVERILFQLRLVRAEAERQTAVAGVLLAEGIGAYPLICEGP